MLAVSRRVVDRGLRFAVRGATAHVGTVREAGGSAPVPTWYLLLAGGGVVALSFLFTSLVGDHDALRQVNDVRVALSLPATLRRGVVWVGRVGGLALLSFVVAVAFAGPQRLSRNFAALFALVGWWGGYTATTFLVGNTWPAVSPWHLLPGSVTGRVDLPDRFGRWPGAAALLALAFVAVVVPLDRQPRLVGVAAVGYTLVTATGVALVGSGAWFDRVDPLAATFRAYGAVAPVGRTDDGLALRLPGSGVVGTSATRGDAGFAVALLWVSTYDGVVSTVQWRAALAPLVRAGVPPQIGYLVALVAGFCVFFGAFRLAARASRDLAETYVTAAEIERRLAPSLLLIAAGYHVAHFAGSMVALAPTLLAVASAPLSPPTTVPVVVVPGWFGQFELVSILLGHMAGVWVAHSISFELFPGVLQPIRSQYPFVAVMILYTVVSMWAVVAPAAPTPFV